MRVSRRLLLGVYSAIHRLSGVCKREVPSPLPPTGCGQCYLLLLLVIGNLILTDTWMHACLLEQVATVECAIQVLLGITELQLLP